MEKQIASLKRLRNGAPVTAHDAMNFIYLYWVMSEEFESIQVRTLGNLDRLLTPYYRADLKAGRTTEAEFREQVRHFWWLDGLLLGTAHVFRRYQGGWDDGVHGSFADDVRGSRRDGPADTQDARQDREVDAGVGLAADARHDATAALHFLRRRGTALARHPFARLFRGAGAHVPSLGVLRVGDQGRRERHVRGSPQSDEAADGFAGRGKGQSVQGRDIRGLRRGLPCAADAPREHGARDGLRDGEMPGRRQSVDAVLARLRTERQVGR